MNEDDTRAGPALWLLTIAITTLLLIAATMALWLVVPFLVAIILYYILLPMVHRLIASGMRRQAAAAVDAGAIAAQAPTPADIPRLIDERRIAAIARAL